MIETHKEGKFSWEAEIETLRQQLAASQAREMRLRKATGCLLHLCDIIGPPDGPLLYKARQALALPQDTTAIEAMIAEAGEVMRERCDKVLECIREEYGDEEVSAAWVFRAIHNTPGVTMGDLK